MTAQLAKRLLEETSRLIAELDAQKQQDEVHRALQLRAALLDYLEGR